MSGRQMEEIVVGTDLERMFQDIVLGEKINPVLELGLFQVRENCTYIVQVE